MGGGMGGLQVSPHLRGLESQERACRAFHSDSEKQLFDPMIAGKDTYLGYFIFLFAAGLRAASCFVALDLREDSFAVARLGCVIRQTTCLSRRKLRDPQKAQVLWRLHGQHQAWIVVIHPGPCSRQSCTVLLSVH